MYLCINVMQCNAMHVCMYACIYTYLFKHTHTHTHTSSLLVFFRAIQAAKETSSVEILPCWIFWGGLAIVVAKAAFFEVGCWRKAWQSFQALAANFCMNMIGMPYRFQTCSTKESLPLCPKYPQLGNDTTINYSYSGPLK